MTSNDRRTKARPIIREWASADPLSRFHVRFSLPHRPPCASEPREPRGHPHICCYGLRVPCLHHVLVHGRRRPVIISLGQCPDELRGRRSVTHTQPAWGSAVFSRVKVAGCSTGKPTRRLRDTNNAWRDPDAVVPRWPASAA